MPEIILKPLDKVLQTYGAQLAAIGSGKARMVMGRALTHEGRKTFTLVKRVLRDQTSIPRAQIEKGTRFQQATLGGAGPLEVQIIGTGSELPLKMFQPHQFKLGTKAKVWGKWKMHEGAFMGPRHGVVAPALHGHAFHRTSKARLPIEKLYGPSIPKEMVKDKSAAAFYASAPRIVDRVGHELAALLSGAAPGSSRG